MFELNEVKIFNETKEYILSLRPSSYKHVKRVCPYCGKEKSVQYRKVTEVGHTFCAGCISAIKNIESLIGKKFGKLLVISKADPILDKAGKRNSAVKCLCDCGSFVNVRAIHLKNGSVVSCGCRKRAGGENSPTWNPNISPEVRAKYLNGRRDNRSVLWKKSVKERDGFKCRVCGSRKKIVAHHIESFTVEDLRFAIENGICLCMECHMDYHIRFMGNYRNKATKKSFEEWLKCR